MATEVYISHEAKPKGALSHESLFATGLNEVRRLANQTWTDHNDHDPGITTLEFLSYALTGLAYHASVPIEDLVARTAPEGGGPLNQFFAPSEILPTHPVTLSDYRRLVMDVDGVRNAWIQPHEESLYWVPGDQLLLTLPTGRPHGQKMTLRGLYEVTVEFEPGITSASEKNSVLERVRFSLAENQNLGEEFSVIKGLERDLYYVDCKIHIDNPEDGGRIAAEAHQRLENCFSRSVRRFSIEECPGVAESRGWSNAELLEGPLLKRGFVDPVEMEDEGRPAKITIAEITSLLLEIPGVTTISNLTIGPVIQDKAIPRSYRREAPVGDTLTFDLTRSATYAKESSRLRLYSDGIPVSLDLLNSETAPQVKGETPARRSHFQVGPPRLESPSLPDHYASFQTDFPELYGLRHEGITDKPSTREERLILQFRAYLLFFDQVMANYLAQLRHVPELLSFSNRSPTTYHEQPVADLPGKNVLLHSPLLTAACTPAEERLHTNRRNRFLDHLLARHGETLDDYTRVMSASNATDPVSPVAVKRGFMASYAEISTSRALGYDSTQPLQPTERHLSGFERYIAAKLGIPARSDWLTEVSPDAYCDVSETMEGRFRFVLHCSSDSAVRVTSLDTYSSAAAAREGARETINCALGKATFRVSRCPRKYQFWIQKNQGDIAHSEVYQTESALEEALKLFASDLHRRYSPEGLYAIELISLRPRTSDDPHCPACQPSSVDEAPVDAYSYRMRILLPGYSPRFASLHFRQMAERVIREEVPAHMVTTICWISRTRMSSFESAYFHWLAVRTNAQQRPAALRSVIEALFSGRNIHQRQTVRLKPLPSRPSLPPRFRLGHSILGSGIGAIFSAASDRQ